MPAAPDGDRTSAWLAGFGVFAAWPAVAWDAVVVATLALGAAPARGRVGVVVSAGAAVVWVALACVAALPEGAPRLLAGGWLDREAAGVARGCAAADRAKRACVPNSVSHSQTDAPRQARPTAAIIQPLARSSFRGRPGQRPSATKMSPPKPSSVGRMASRARSCAGVTMPTLARASRLAGRMARGLGREAGPSLAEGSLWFAGLLSPIPAGGTWFHVRSSSTPRPFACDGDAGLAPLPRSAGARSV